MNDHNKKMIAPVIITVIVVLYYIAYFVFILHFVRGIGGFLLGIIPLALAAVMIYVCLQRIREIRNGEEDDLDRY